MSLLTSTASMPAGFRSSLMRFSRSLIFTIFPYTTLFRSNRVDSFQIGLGGEFVHEFIRPFIEWNIDIPVNRSDYTCDENVRSEEHTSELQSRLHLVCRLLLEKKK